MLKLYRIFGSIWLRRKRSSPGTVARCRCGRECAVQPRIGLRKCAKCRAFHSMRRRLKVMSIGFEEGQQAWVEGKELDDNPYEVDSEEFLQWITGWESLGDA